MKLLTAAMMNRTDMRMCSMCMPCCASFSKLLSVQA